MSSPQGCVLISLYQAQQLKLRGLLNAQHGALKAQPLLVPLALKLNESEWQVRSVIHRPCCNWVLS